MHRNLLLTTFLLMFIAAYASSVFAENRDIGVGLVLGEPTGFSVKYMKTDNIAYDAALAWSFADKSHLHLHADLLHHNWTLLQREFGITRGALPLYYGIGGRLKLADETRIGFRFVVGVSYLIEDGPMDAFFEIAPIMDIAPETKLNGNVALGLRYWF
ncbi:hypothetical protein ACFL47_08620 [Candidatus Latescibacterota bacterium]